MKSGFKALALMAIAVLLTSCGGGGTSSSQESFVSGNGSVTFISPDKRVNAPAMSGMTLSGTNYKYEVGKVAVVNVWASGAHHVELKLPLLPLLQTNIVKWHS